MSESLAATIAAYSGAVALWACVRAVTRRGLSRGQIGAVAVVELAALVQVAVAAVGLIGGHDPSEPGVLIAYLVASVAILPLVLPLASGDDSPWGAVTLALGLAAVAVVSLRGVAVWQG